MEFFVIWTCAVALGGLTARQLRLPGATLLGAMLAAAFITFAGGQSISFSTNASLGMQGLIGTMLAFSVDRKVVGLLCEHWRLLGASIVITMLVWTAVVLSVTATGLLELSSAMVGSAPAGPSIAFLTTDQGLVIQTITLLLALRILLVSGALTVMLKVRSRQTAANPIVQYRMEHDAGE